MTVVTTPIYYINGSPHIGHAYTSVLADIFARNSKLSGEDTYLLTGTDEHGDKVSQKALELNLSPQEHVDILSKDFIRLAHDYNIAYDSFVRTTSSHHKDVVTGVFARLLSRGYIYSGSYNGYYSIREESFVKNDDIVFLDGKPYSHDGELLEFIEEDCLFFRLSSFKQQVYDFLSQDVISPSYYSKEALNALDEINDIAISRTRTKWGIPVPGYDGHVFYVWFDALLSYITGLETLGFNEVDTFQLVHFIGKDILKFHAILWPAILSALDLPFPEKIYVNGWFTANGKKISKSTGNTVDPFEIASRFSVDVIRGYFSTITPGKDNDYNDKSVEEYANTIASTYGNLILRVFKYASKRFNQNINMDIEDKIKEELSLDVLNNATCAHAIMNASLSISRELNAFMDNHAPWTKDDKEALQIVNYIIAILLVLNKKLSSIFPATSELISSYIEAEDNQYLLVEYGEMIPPCPRF